MFNRTGMTRSGSSFAAWMEQQQSEDDNKDENSGGFDFTVFSVMGQLSAIQDNVTTQFQELSGSLPEAGPLSAAFRTRITHAVYLLIASAGFGLLAVIVGLPTLVIRPSKFVICITLCTGLGAASVIVMQKPSVFLANLIKGGVQTSLPLILLLFSVLLTLYVTIFVHKYLVVLAAGCGQIFFMLYYLASFIPGGSKGLQILLRTAFMIIKTALAPCIFICKKTTSAFISRLVS